MVHFKFCALTRLFPPGVFWLQKPALRNRFMGTKDGSTFFTNWNQFCDWIRGLLALLFKFSPLASIVFFAVVPFIPGVYHYDSERAFSCPKLCREVLSEMEINAFWDFLSLKSVWDGQKGGSWGVVIISFGKHHLITDLFTTCLQYRIVKCLVEHLLYRPNLFSGGCPAPRAKIISAFMSSSTITFLELVLLCFKRSLGLKYALQEAGWTTGFLYELLTVPHSSCLYWNVFKLTTF